jgi:hypothetical protein
MRQRRRDRLTQKARFCLATGLSPAEYDVMPRELRHAFIAEINRRAR